MTKNKQIAMWLPLVILILIATSCSSGAPPGESGNNENAVISNSSKTVEESTDDTPELPAPEDAEAKNQFANSSPERDTDVGLKNIKIDTAEMTLSDTQKAVIEYFDDDYLYVPSYEFLRRYPAVFLGAQLRVSGLVAKTISMDSDNYEIVLQFWEYDDDGEFIERQYFLLTGKTGQAWYMEGDTLEAFGRYEGVETVVIDGTSYTIPKIHAYSSYIGVGLESYEFVQKFDATFIKKVAKVIFGDDIEVRKPVADVDVPEWALLMWEEVGASTENPPIYVVEREDQSNAKFTKFFFLTSTNKDVWGDNRIEVAKDYGNSSIERSVEFAADFSHFFMFTYDTDMESLTLEYYDSNLNKMWKREFEETTSAMYDFTKNNLYLAVNNELYIINIQTGEDTFEPSYVGPKKAIRKLGDGILMISEGKSDGVMKVGLDGRIIWKTNLQEDTYDVAGVQLVGDNIVIEQYYWNSPDDYGTHFLVLNNADGSLIADAVSVG